MSLHAGVSSQFFLVFCFFPALSDDFVLLSVLHAFFFFPSPSPSFSLSCAGDVLFQMAEVHRQIQVQLEEMVGILSSKGS